MGDLCVHGSLCAVREHVPAKSQWRDQSAGILRDDTASPPPLSESDLISSEIGGFGFRVSGFGFRIKGLEGTHLEISGEGAWGLGC